MLLREKLAEAEAARAEADAQQVALAHDMATWSKEKERLTTQLDHYMGRADELVQERGLSASQLAELTKSFDAERARYEAEAEALRDSLAQVEAAAAEGSRARADMEQQNVELKADLKEVTVLIDQLEGEPGFVRQRLRKSALSPHAKRQQEAAAEAIVKAEGLRAEIQELRARLAEREEEVQTLRSHQAESEETALLREENRILESQLELLSEKMYGSPAKSAAKERDRLQIELERERTERAHAEETVNILHAELERAHARVAELMSKMAVDEKLRADLQSTRRALQAAQTNAALGLLQTKPSRMANPIAAPRHQFGPAGGAYTPATRGRPSSAGVSGTSGRGRSATPTSNRPYAI